MPYRIVNGGKYQIEWAGRDQAESLDFDFAYHCNSPCLKGVSPDAALAAARITSITRAGLDSMGMWLLSTS